LGVSALGAAAPRAAAGGAAAGSVLRLGVQTHLAQRDPPSLLARLAEAHIDIPFVRDEIYWAQLEPRPGQFDWSRADALLAAVAGAGKGLLWTADWSNPIYEDLSALGKDHQRGVFSFPSSDRVRAAFANYVLAVLARYAHPKTGRYPGVIRAVEVWNEANGTWSGGYGLDVLPGLVTKLTHAVYAAVRAIPAYDDIPIVGGACVLMPTNYLKACIAEGLLKSVDAVAVHPYGRPEILLELAQRTRKLIDEAGGRQVQLWATEFGNASQPAELIKQLAVSTASPFAASSYYLASADSTGPGLIDGAGRPTEVGKAWSMWADLFRTSRLLERRPSQPKCFILAFKAQDDRRFCVAWTRWGTARIKMEAPFRQAFPQEAGSSGGIIDVDANPRLIFSDGPVSEVEDNGTLIADSTRDFASAGARSWSYLWRTPGGEAAALTPMSDGYGDFLGIAGVRFARIDRFGAHPGLMAGKPIEVIRRWTCPPSVSRVRLTVMAERTAATGAGVRVEIRRDGEVLDSKVLLASSLEVSHDLECRAGEQIDFVTVSADGHSVTDGYTEWWISIFDL
jgi:hypothetical protein